MEQDKRKEVYKWRHCIEEECGHKKFFISVAEKEYFEQRQTDEGKPFALPKRCYQCRVRRRQGTHGTQN